MFKVDCRLLAVGIVAVALAQFVSSAEAVCYDRITDCARATHLCQDARHGPTIRRNCNLSCGVCRPTRKQACTDNPRCRTWTLNGYCNSSAYTRWHKQHNCPKACGLCSKRSSRKKKGRQPKRKPKKKPHKKPHKKTPPKRKETPYPPFREAMNERYNPCNDFYHFACGTYIARHPPTRPGMNANTFNDLQTKVDEQINALVMDRTPGKLDPVKKMQAFRDECLNAQKVDAARTTALWNTMKGIGGGFPMLTDGWAPASFKLQEVVTKLTADSGTSFLFAFSAQKMPDGKTWLIVQPADTILVDSKMYFDSKAASIVRAAQDFVAQLVGFVASDQRSTKTYRDIEAAVKDTFEFEKELFQVLIRAGIGQPAAPGADPMSVFDKTKFNDLKAVVTQLNWDEFVRDNPQWDAELRTYFGKNPDLLMYNKKILQAADAFYKAANPQRLANYLFVQFLIKKAPYLDSRFEAASNRFVQLVDPNGQQSTRPQNCFGLTVRSFPLVRDHLFVQKHLSSSTVRVMERMIEDLRAGLAQTIRGQKWMDGRTKANALKKLQKTKRYIGAMEEAKDANKLEKIYADLQFDPSTDPLDQIAARISFHDTRLGLKEVFSSDYALLTMDDTNAAVVNAFNSPNFNAIYMNAGILQSPFVDPKQPAAVNYGSIGGVIGHEYTHGFDNQGANFDEYGTHRNWWESATRKKFDDRAKCFVDLYSKQWEPTARKHVNGTLTVGENIADNGGIRAAFNAYKRHLKGKKERHVSGYSKYTNEQTFFISYARTYCTSHSKPYIAMLLTQDTHSPGKDRVNVVVSNYPEFAKAFKCKRGTKMNPRKQCAVW